MSDGLARHRLLQRLQESRHLLIFNVRQPSCFAWCGRWREHQQVYVLRHDDIRQELKTEFLPGRFQRFTKPLASSITQEEWVAAIATESQLPRFTVLVESPSSFFNVRSSGNGIDQSHVTASRDWRTCN
jgi:hypothetical protein